jgi:Arc/MetJ-type ribon-helix-helix transcriptional regulator
MTTITLSLPDPLGEFIQKQKEQGRYDDAGDYVRDVLLAERVRQTRAEIDAKLLEALDGPFEDVTPKDFANIRAQMRT